MTERLPTSLVAATKPKLVDWAESVRCKTHGWGRWRFHARTIQPWSLKASGLAVRILRDLDELQSVGQTQRQEAVDYFLSCQDPADGLFKDPLETSEFYIGHHSWPQVWGQRHASALEALALLGAQPRYPLPPQFADLSRVDGRIWTLTQIDWSNPWSHGESWSRAIRAYLRPMPSRDRHDRHPALVTAFAALEAEILDPDTGLPSRRMPAADPDRAVAGLFKVMSAYLAVGRPVPHAQQAIDFILGRQLPTGEFSSHPNTCLNWDPLWVLWHLDKQLAAAYRHQDIVSAGQRLAGCLMTRYYKADGGFAMYREHCPTNHHSIRVCDQPYPISDMVGSLMCLRCLQYVDVWTGAAPDFNDELDMEPGPADQR